MRTWPLREEPTRFAGLPNWLASVVLHLVLLIALALLLRRVPQGAVSEPLREAGIVLKSRAALQQYEGPEEPTEDSAADTAAAPADLAAALPSEAPLDPSDALPRAADLPLPGGGSGRTPLLSVRGMTSTAQPQRGLRGGGQTSVFGLSGSGYKFVYVFDRSGSMGGSARSPLAVAKAELLNSLESLDRTHQFQIIFYNDQPAMFDLSGRGVGLVFGDEQGKALARQFVEGITAHGGTRHEEALSLALRLQPDVIFFLTDADHPVLTPLQLERITRRNHGTAINTIEFGIGPGGNRENFLTQLARQNGGQYVYVDITRLARD